MGRKAKRARRAAEVSVDELNRRLQKLARRAAKAARGSGGAKSREALRRVEWLEAAGLRLRCCGKSLKKGCRSCPRRQAELILAPLSERPDAA